MRRPYTTYSTLRYSTLRKALESKYAALEIDPDAVVLEELRADDPAQLEAEQDARRVQVQHHHRKVLVLNLLECQIDAGQQEGVFLPPRRAPHLQRNLADVVLVDRALGRVADRDHLAARVDDEVDVVAAGDDAVDRRQPVEA